MATNKVTATAMATEIGTIETNERIVRTVIAFMGFLAVVTGVATSSLQYFMLSVLGIYLVNTAIMGLDPFHAAVHYLRAAWRPKVNRTSFSVPSPR